MNQFFKKLGILQPKKQSENEEALIKNLEIRNEQIKDGLEYLKKLADSFFSEGKDDLGIKVTTALAGAETEYALKKAKELWNNKRQAEAAPIVAELIKHDYDAVRRMISQCVLKGPIETDVKIAIAEMGREKDTDPVPGWVIHIKNRCEEKGRLDLIDEIDVAIKKRTGEIPTIERYSDDEIQKANDAMIKYLDNDEFIKAAERASATGDVVLVHNFQKLTEGLKNNGQEEKAAEIASVLAQFYGARKEKEKKTKQVA